MANNDTEKLKALVLYIAERCGHLDRFGKVKLNKILYFADMRSYLETGSTLTGVPYVKDVFGPVPENMDAVLDELEDAGSIALTRRAMPDLKTQTRVIPKRGPNLGLFTYEQLKFVEDTLDMAKNESAHDLSEWSHGLPGWRAARMGEEIPAFAALLQARRLPLNEREIVHARDLADGLLSAR